VWAHQLVTQTGETLVVFQEQLEAVVVLYGQIGKILGLYVVVCRIKIESKNALPLNLIWLCHKHNTTDEYEKQALELHVPMVWSCYFEMLGAPISDAVTLQY